MPIKLPSFRQRRDAYPPDLWTKCPSCEEMLFNRQLDKVRRVCPSCGHHFRLPVAARLSRAQLDMWATAGLKQWLQHSPVLKPEMLDDYSPMHRGPVSFYVLTITTPEEAEVATRMKACIATRASEPPTLIRRTPIAARSSTVKPKAPLLRKLTGFGATAFTTASICSRVLMPGA